VSNSDEYRKASGLGGRFVGKIEELINVKRFCAEPPVGA